MGGSPRGIDVGIEVVTGVAGNGRQASLQVHAVTLGGAGGVSIINDVVSVLVRLGPVGDMGIKGVALFAGDAGVTSQQVASMTSLADGLARALGGGTVDRGGGPIGRMGVDSVASVARDAG